MSKIDLSMLSKVQLGDYSESLFVTEALKRSFSVYKPFGSQEGCDFIVEKNGKLLKIQVKSTAKIKTSSKGSLYSRVHAKHPRKYDFLIAIDHIEANILIVPVSELKGVELSASSKPNAKYINAWHLLK